eukprot:scaffold46035_cov65-Phaeocystis_antarctica.AAC.1
MVLYKVPLWSGSVCSLVPSVRDARALRSAYVVPASVLCATPHPSVRESHATPRRKQQHQTPEKRLTARRRLKVVQNAVLNGMPTLAAANPAAAIIVLILTH